MAVALSRADGAAMYGVALSEFVSLTIESPDTYGY